MVYLHGPGTSGLFQFLFPPFLTFFPLAVYFIFGSQVVGAVLLDFNRVITSNPFQFATVVAGVLKLKKMGTDAR
jgi:hypothetical protein